MIRQYLLGQLPQEDSARLEERLLSDSDYFQEILIGEDELIDRYLANQLSEAERQAFETSFLLTRERQQKLRFARSLKKYIGEAAATTAGEEAEPESSGERSHDFADAPSKNRHFFSFVPAQNPILSYSLAAAALLVVVGVSWIATKNWRTPQTGPGNVLTVVLTPGLTREGGEVPKINLSPEIDTVELRLELPKSDYRTYRSVLLADDRSQVWARDDLRAVNDSGTSFVVSNVPAKLLADGDYRIKISGRSSDGLFEDLATYSFRLVR